jgi:ABC-type sugar transport system ATPase subunit
MTSSVTIRRVSKRYGDNFALRSLDLDVAPGEILGVAGPNGAGKSTMVRLLAGEELPDSGEITIGGSPWDGRTDLQRVAIVHQETELFPNLTVGENLMAGREGTKTRRPRLTDADRDILRSTDLLPFVDVNLGQLSLALQQRVEIARALSRNAEVFLFDEPNSALTEHESDELFARIHSLASAGNSVLLVTHRLAELAQHADRVAMIVDGRCRLVLEKDELTEHRLAAEFTASRSGEIGRLAQQRSDEPIAVATRWSARSGAFDTLDIIINRGEVIAVTGVEGSGGRELIRSIAGVESASGTVTFARESRSQQLVEFVAADRSESLYSNLTVAENVLARMTVQGYGKLKLTKPRVRRALAGAAMTTYGIKTASPDAPIRSLSGGNQQKVAIASAMSVSPTMVVLEEPTRGVDLASKAEIYRLLADYAAAGHAVLMFCTEDTEVIAAANRVIVIAAGKLVDDFTIEPEDDPDHTRERINRLTVEGARSSTPPDA